MDASFRFNLKKRNDFLVRNKFRALKTKPDSSFSSKTDQKKNSDRMQHHKHSEDTQILQMPKEIQAFLLNQHFPDRFHWNNPDRSTPNHGFNLNMMNKRFTR